MIPSELVRKAMLAVKNYALSDMGRDTDAYFDADKIARVALEAVWPEIAADRDQWKEAAQSYESRDNPFGCFHALRFIWRDAAGQTACAACRLIAAEKLEQELAQSMSAFDGLAQQCQK